jgi:hypothetical protein
MLDAQIVLALSAAILLGMVAGSGIEIIVGLDAGRIAGRLRGRPRGDSR